MRKVSIIIPCISINNQTLKCIKKCLELDYEDFEILVLPDYCDKKSKNKNLKIIETGKVKPALKRNIGMKLAIGDFFAFIDDDAYPRKDWLKNAIKYFDNDKIGLVGGPNLTPEDANFAEKVSGHVLSNFLISGNAFIRYKITKNKKCKELPSCNYISRDLDIEYDSNFLTAEDSKYCFDISKKGYDILYASDVVVYHHRRDKISKHIKQMYIYGRDIAWLTKKEFSIDKLYYSLLSIFSLLVIFGILLSFDYSSITGLSILETTKNKIYFSEKIFLAGIFIYLILILFSSLKESFIMSLVVFATSILTHFAYGFGWLKGIITSPEKNEKVAWNSR